MGFDIFVTYFDVFHCLYEGVYSVGEFIIYQFILKITLINNMCCFFNIDTTV